MFPMKKTLSLSVLTAAFFLGACSKAQTADTPKDAAAPKIWMTNAHTALQQAKAEGKLVLMDFTGSDWCIWCKRLDREVFSTTEFKAYADENLVLLKLDFPNKSNQPQWEIDQNQALAEKYDIEGFPTIVVLNADGEEIARLGYQQGGPEAWLEQVKRL
jgi:protein disulfide-isomerase